LKILQVCAVYQSGIGGISEHVRSISERLARKHDVTVYATNPGDHLPWREIVNRVKVERFKCFAPSSSYFFSSDIMTRLLKTKFDVVHGHGYHAFPMHLSSLTKSRKLIVTTHFHGAGHTTFRNCLFKLFKHIGKMSLIKADNIVAVSDFEKRLLCDFFKLDPNRVVVIPNGLDLSEFTGLRRYRRGVKSILYVGRLETYKGVQYLVEVLPKLGDDVVLEIVGSGSLRKALENRAEQLGVHDRVLFSQNLQRCELLQKYANADVFVLLSAHEAYSLVVAEALTAGTSSIVANTSALSEWVDNRSCFGVGFPIRLDELTELINNVLDGRVNREAMKSWIGTKILQWDEVVQRLEDIYDVS